MSSPQTMLDTNTGTTQFGTTGGFCEIIGTGTEVSNAVTINASNCLITTESLSTPSTTSHIITLTNSYITSSSVLISTIVSANMTSLAQYTAVIIAVPGNGSAQVNVRNTNGAHAFNGTFTICILVI